MGAALMLIAVFIELAPSCFAVDSQQQQQRTEDGVDLSPTESSPLLAAEGDERRNRMSSL